MSARKSKGYADVETLSPMRDFILKASLAICEVEAQVPAARSELSAWLRACVMWAGKVSDLQPGVWCLTENGQPPRKYSRAFKTCDRCEQYRDVGLEYRVLQLPCRTPAFLVLGLCPQCAEEEGL